MAAGEMIAECLNCGQRIRDGWHRCPRCRQVLSDKRVERAAPSAAPDSSPPRLWQGVTLAVLALVAVVVGVAGWDAPGSISAASSSPPTETPAQRVAQTRAVDAVVLATHQSADAGRAGYA